MLKKFPIEEVRQQLGVLEFESHHEAADLLNEKSANKPYS